STAIITRRDFRISPFYRRLRIDARLEPFPFRLNRNGTPDSLFWRVFLTRTGSPSLENALADELDADQFAAAPDHLAAASGPGVARERQPQLRRQRVGIVDRDLRPRRGQILHHALARGKTALERDPPGLAQ